MVSTFRLWILGTCSQRNLAGKGNEGKRARGISGLKVSPAGNAQGVWSANGKGLKKAVKKYPRQGRVSVWGRRCELATVSAQEVVKSSLTMLPSRHRQGEEKRGTKSSLGVEG